MHWINTVCQRQNPLIRSWLTDMAGGAASPVFASLQDQLPEQLFRDLPTPCYVIDEAQLERNAEILKSVSDHTGVKILLAQKAFSSFSFYPLLSRYLAGTEASGFYEARLGSEEMPGREVHVFCAAYTEAEFKELLSYADHIVFNSIHQLAKFGPLAKRHGKSIGLRINPECSTQEAAHSIYDPCAPGSRLGVSRAVFDEEMSSELLALIDGLHFHTLCEQDADALAVTVSALEKNFADILPKVKWLNMGGGHHITKPGYHISLLEQTILSVKEKWHVEVYLEPGEAVALNAGYLVSRVLDVVQNQDQKIAILDASAACHMPDVIEMPYRPPLFQMCEKGFPYRLTGPTCLAGDVIGDYELIHPLQENDLLIFGDMAIYTMVKNNTFNGMPLPGIYQYTKKGSLIQLCKFGYHDFKMRLGK